MMNLAWQMARQANCPGRRCPLGHQWSTWLSWDLGLLKGTSSLCLLTCGTPKPDSQHLPPEWLHPPLEVSFSCYDLSAGKEAKGNGIPSKFIEPRLHCSENWFGLPQFRH